MLFGFVSILVWGIATESGLKALARLARSAAPGNLTLGEVRGRLIGPLEVDLLALHTPDLALRLETLALEWTPWDLLSGRVAVSSLTLARLDVHARASDAPSPPARLPDQLRLPVALHLPRIEIETLTIHRAEASESLSAETTGAFTVRNIALGFDSDSQRHRLQRLDASLTFGRLNASGSIDAVAPFALESRATLSGDIQADQLPEGMRIASADRDYRIEMDATGVLAEPVLNLRASGAGLRGEGHVEATPFADVPLKALELALGEFEPSMFFPAAPKARLRLDASLRASATDGLTLSGPFSLRNERPATVDAGGLPVESLGGTLTWSEKAVGVEGLDVRLPGGGTIGGKVTWSPPAPRAATADASDITQRVDGLGRLALLLELAGIDTARLDTRLPRQQLQGHAEAKASESRQTVSVKLNAGAASLVASAEVDAPTASGAERPFRLKAALRKLDPRKFHPSAPAARLNLDVDAQGALAETADLSVRFKLVDSALEGSALSGNGRFKVLGQTVSDALLALDLAGNRARVEGDWGRPGDRLRFSLDAPALAAIGHGLGGRGGAEGELGGGIAAPAGSIRFFGEQLLLPGGVRIAGLNGEGQLAAGVDGPFSLSAGVSGVGAVGADPDWIAVAHLSAQGRRDQHRIELSLTGAEADALEAVLDGGLKSSANAAPRWEGRLLSLTSTGRFVSHLQAPAGLTLGADRVELDEAVLVAGEKGRIRLEATRWSATGSVLKGALTGLSFGLESRPEGRPRRGGGSLMLGAEWDLRLAETVEGEARLFRESGDLVVSGEIGTRLGLERFEARLVARNNRLALSVGALGTELGELSGSLTALAERSAQGGWQLAPQAPLLGSARLQMQSIAWLGRLMRENVETAGSLDASFSVAGTPAQPEASGSINGRDLQFALIDQGLILRGGELVADFNRDRLRLSALRFVSPNRVRPRDDRVPFAALTATPGQFVASGEVALDSGKGSFVFSADRLPLLQREDRWLILSGKGRAASTWTSLDIDADFRADAGFVAIGDSPPPSLSDDVVVLGRKTAEPGRFALKARLGVNLGDALYLSAMGVDTRLAGTLELRMAPGVPLYAVGTISTVGGSYQGYGQRLSIERGLINFQGAIDNPGLNIVALRKGLEVEAGVAISGSARRPQVKLVSEPAVPDPEKLSWIVLGRAPDAGGGADLALLLPAAQALLGGDSGGGMTAELSRSLGLDTFSIGQGELNSTSRAATSRVLGSGSRISSGPTVAGQVLSVGKRLSADLVLSFEQSLGGAESLVKLTYQLGRRVSVVARGGTDNALDIYYTFSFR
ncbi:translocation/assembly module TamB domain-containing protein [Azoarcus sp. L1K30]|uniref:translocation/assembly module TamB domain-containing protein n=1 Tax=Azoarcus sp. L1K30 TaxID=2820277 RepID=UPI0032C2229A